MEVQEWIAAFSGERPWIAQSLGLVVLFFIGWLADLIVRRWLARLVAAAASRSENRWDDALLEARFFRRVANLAPALFIYFGVNLLGFEPTVALLIQRVALAVTVIVAAAAVSSFLDALSGIYSRLPDVGRRPIKGYLGFVRLLFYFVAVIIALSILMDRSPWIFLSGLGAVSAVLLIIFRDTLLSLVASVQITNSDLLKVGDWIEMPSHGADGDVIDVALHIVKVQNWDKTITTIPTYAFLSGSFKNWRGMSESNSRRIKRSIMVDIATVRFLEDDELERFSKFALLADYVAEKQRELAEYNANPGGDASITANIRRLTNVGTLRVYIREYLKHHPKIHDERTLIVRQLQSGPEGLPIEVYCFTNDIAWENHEAIQSDLFDHFLAIAREFDLRIFQNPSGADFSQFARGNPD